MNQIYYSLNRFKKKRKRIQKLENLNSHCPPENLASNRLRCNPNSKSVSTPTLQGQWYNTMEWFQVVDIGSGKGYLPTTLALQYKLPVIGIDSSDSNTAGAATRRDR